MSTTPVDDTPSADQRSRPAVHRLAAATAVIEYLPWLALYLVVGLVVGDLLAQAQLDGLFPADRVADSDVVAAADSVATGSAVLVSAVMAGGTSGSLLAVVFTVIAVLAILVAVVRLAVARWRGTVATSSIARNCVQTISRTIASRTIVLLIAAAQLHQRGVGLPVHTGWIITAVIASAVAIITDYLRRAENAQILPRGASLPIGRAIARPAPATTELAKGTSS
ncbi:hypothetical protein [Gordonia humi]|uniref:Uncharacterized membrane protein YhaH (DUF805 family) n=1 Tax=Gordonia humi TaxID=686429 RepID=A0A840F6P4_9ACTN|nr:hypothetical protein [Gordonia humi]MBB4138078.1 uncharacterized membrane protein YhaH (DUF805 family) [Gordonia humi]